MKRFSVGIVITALGSCTLFLSACDEPPEVKAEATQFARSQAEPEAGADSPAGSASLIHRYHQQRDYELLAPLIVGADRDGLIRFLKALDQVLDASRLLHEAGLKRFGRNLPEVLDLTKIEHNLGLFSRDISIISQRFVGNGAEVSLQEAENIPLVRVRFVQEDGVWRCAPSAVTHAQIESLSALACNLTDLSHAVTSGVDRRTILRMYYDQTVPRLARLAQMDRTTNRRASR